MAPNYKINDKKAFVNPYNFITSNYKNCKREEMSFGEYTGVIKCTLTTKSDLIIPDLASKDGNDHKTYGFFKVGEQYCIPGSSLRGVIRSNYEALTNSCYVTARSADPLHARDDSWQAKQPGLLVWEGEGENKTIALYSAKRYMLWTGDERRGGKLFREHYGQTHYNLDYRTGILERQYKIGKNLKFNAAKSKDGSEHQYKTSRGFGTTTCMVKNIDENGELTGYLCIGEYFSSKHHESIFTKVGKENVETALMYKAIENYKRVIDIYQDKAINKNNNESRTWYKNHKQKFSEFENAKIEAFPVWYKYNSYDQILQLSPGQISRTVFTKSEQDLIGELAPCVDRNRLCPACRLFGMIADDKEGNQSAASRIRVSDAIAEAIEGETEQRTLAELSSPKPSYMGFYTNSGPNVTYDNSGVKLRGRKYYWSTDITKPDSTNPTKRNGTFEVVPKGSTFKFDLYFDRISEQERAEILWVLTMGENKVDSGFCLHIGHGKPFGYGSVKVTVDAIITRDAINGWEAKREENVTISACLDENYKQNKYGLRMMNNTNFCMKDRISYPYILNPQNDDNNYAAHRWFREAKGHDQCNLPTIKETMDGTRFLKPYERIEQPHRGR